MRLHQHWLQSIGGKETTMHDWRRCTERNEKMLKYKMKNSHDIHITTNVEELRPKTTPGAYLTRKFVSLSSIERDTPAIPRRRRRRDERLQCLVVSTMPRSTSKIKEKHFLTSFFFHPLRFSIECITMKSLSLDMHSRPMHGQAAEWCTIWKANAFAKRNGQRARCLIRQTNSMLCMGI